MLQRLKILLGFCLVFASQAQARTCENIDVEFRCALNARGGCVGEGDPDEALARFRAEVAFDDATRARGLMFVEHLEPNRGMLFVYDAPIHARFWMRNTYLPLDLIFVNSEGIVTRVYEDARPMDETIIDGGPGVQFVLEVNAGVAQRFDITTGVRLVPVFEERSVLLPNYLTFLCK